MISMYIISGIEIIVYLVYDIEFLFSTTCCKEEVKIVMWQRWLDIYGMYLSVDHYTSSNLLVIQITSMHDNSYWNNAWEIGLF